MFEEGTHIEREKQQAEGKHANAPVGRAEWDKWRDKVLDIIAERLDDDADYTEQWMNDCNAVFKKWTEAMNGRLKECDYSNNEIEKKLAVLNKKEAKLDAAILRAETLEKCYLTVFKSALDKNSVQPQGTPAPASTGSAPAEAIPVISAPPAPAMAAQASNGFVPKAEDLLSYPNAAQLGKKSILLLQKLASIMEGKTPPIFTRENIDDWLDITAVRTGDRYVSEWQKLGFIEKKGKSVYGFIPPTATTTATITQPQEAISQPAEGA